MNLKQITFESNWKKAIEILQYIVSEHSEHYQETSQERIERAARNFMISYISMVPGTYIKRAENGVCITMKYLCEPRKRKYKKIFY